MGEIGRVESEPAMARPSGPLWIAVSVLVLILMAYWWLLIENQRSQLAYAERQLELRAEQTSEALAMQIHVLMAEGVSERDHQKQQSPDQRSFGRGKVAEGCQAMGYATGRPPHASGKQMTRLKGR